MERLEYKNELDEKMKLFSLGRLIQYAWDSKSESKEIIINNSINIITSLRSDLNYFIREKIDIIDLPSIAIDSVVLHIFRFSYTSLFVRNELYELLNQYLVEIKESKTTNDYAFINNVFYFAGFFILSNYKELEAIKTSNFITNLIDIEPQVKDKNLSVPILGLAKYILADKKTHIDNEIKEKIGDQYKNLEIKCKKIVDDTFLIKRNSIPNYRRFLSKR